jgi:hypothetical protein
MTAEQDGQLDEEELKLRDDRSVRNRDTRYYRSGAIRGDQLNLIKNTS